MGEAMERWGPRDTETLDSRRVTATGSRAVHPNFPFAPQLPLPQEACNVLPVCNSVDTVQTLLMSRALLVPLIVIMAISISEEVSAEGQVPG